VRDPDDLPSTSAAAAAASSISISLSLARALARLVLVERLVPDAILFQCDDVLRPQRAFDAQRVAARHPVGDSLPSRDPALVWLHHRDHPAERTGRERCVGHVARRRCARGANKRTPAPVKVCRRALVHHLAVARHRQARHVVIALSKELRARARTTGVSRGRRCSAGAKARAAACLVLGFDQSSDQAGAQLLVAERHHRKRVKLLVVGRPGVHLCGAPSVRWCGLGRVREEGRARRRGGEGKTIETCFPRALLPTSRSPRRACVAMCGPRATRMRNWSWSLGVVETMGILV